MPSLTKSEYNQAVDALEKKKGKVPLNDFWASVHSEYAIGQVQGKFLSLGLRDRDLLKSLIQVNAGYSEFIDPSSITSRIDASEYFIDEKWSGSSTLLSTIQVRSINGPLVVDSSRYEIPLTTYLSVDFHRIEVSDYHSIVVVENLEAFLHIDEFVLPESLGHSLVLYRGHDNAAKAALNFLSSISRHSRVLAFMDPDPAGINIALSTPAVTHWLIPKKIQDLEERSHRERFHKQASRYSNRFHALSQSSEAKSCYINAIMTSGIALPQEFLIKSQHPLEIISV